MPIELEMPCNFSGQSFVKAGYFSTEQKSGELNLVGPRGRTQNVEVKIYRTSSEHFAVICPQAKICKPLGVLNLRNTRCHKLNDGSKCGVVLRQRGFDNTVALTFLTDYPSELESWFSAFTWREQQPVRHCSLPVLEEGDEC